MFDQKKNNNNNISHDQAFHKPKGARARANMVQS